MGQKSLIMTDMESFRSNTLELNTMGRIQSDVDC